MPGFRDLLPLEAEILREAQESLLAEMRRWGYRHVITPLVENMDVLDTPQVRDLLACLGAVVSPSDGASLFRVAALPQFSIDPEKLRSGMRSAAKESTLASILPQIPNGSMVLQSLEGARQEIQRLKAKSRAALQVLIDRFFLDRSSPLLKAVLEFVAAWEKKPVTTTGEIGELLEYLEYFREARGIVPMTTQEENAVRITRQYAANCEKVWRAWTEPQALSRWFGPGDTECVTRAELDVRVGGRYRIAFVTEKAKRCMSRRSAGFST